MKSPAAYEIFFSTSVKELSKSHQSRFTNKRSVTGSSVAMKITIRALTTSSGSRLKPERNSISILPPKVLRNRLSWKSKGQIYSGLHRTRTSSCRDCYSAGTPAAPVDVSPGRFHACCMCLDAGNPCSLAGGKTAATRLAASSVLNSNPALESLWSQLLPSTGRTDRRRRFEPQPIRRASGSSTYSSEYLKPNQWLTSDELSSNPELKAFAQLAAQRGFTSMASVTTAYRISQFVGTETEPIHSAGQEFDAPNEVRQRHFSGEHKGKSLGGTDSGPVEFWYGFDQKSRYSYFENLTPSPANWTDSTVSYCRLAFVPNLAGTGNILSISGTEIEGTAGGGEFVTSERSLTQLRSVPHRSRRESCPISRRC